MSNSVEEDLNDGYFVLDGLELGVDAQLSSEGGPLGPVGVAGGGAASRDSTLHVFLCKAEITAERSEGVGVTS